MCMSFTTIRLRDDDRFKVGEYYDIYYKFDNRNENFLGPARLLDIKHFKLNELNVFTSHIDMGIHPIDGKRELMNIYENVDWSRQELSLLLLEQQDTEIRFILPSRIKKTDREANLFTHIPFGYEVVKA